MIKLRVAVLPVLIPVFAIACGSSSSGGSGSGGGAGSGGSGSGFGPGGPFGSPGSGVCVPAAPTTFNNAVCVCDDFAEGGTLTTHAPSGGKADVGIDGHTAAGTAAYVDGSLTAYQGMGVAGLVKVRDDVMSTKTIDGAGVLNVGRDLSVGGPFTFLGALTVKGTLRLADPSIVLIPIDVDALGPYSAPAAAPCDCDPSTLLPIASAVAAAKTTNDNAAHGLSTDSADLIGLEKLTLTSGSYYFTNTARIGASKIIIDGAVSLYFDGSLTEIGAGVVQLNPGASLDLYVNGLLNTAGAVALGDPKHPEAFRLFVGGAGSMMLTAGVQLWSGLIYAPRAVIAFGGVTGVNGSIFAKNLAWGGVLDVYYPGSSGSGGTTCPAVPDAGSTTPAPASSPR